MNSEKSPDPSADRGHKQRTNRILRFPDKLTSTSGPQLSFWNTIKKIGPAIVTGAADLDPSAIVTATVAGAVFSLRLLWVVLLCVPFLLAALDASTRIGLETKQGTFELLRKHYGRKIAIAAAGLPAGVGES